MWWYLKIFTFILQDFTFILQKIQWVCKNASHFLPFLLPFQSLSSTSWQVWKPTLSRQSQHALVLWWKITSSNVSGAPECSSAQVSMWNVVDHFARKGLFLRLVARYLPDSVQIRYRLSVLAQSFIVWRSCYFKSLGLSVFFCSISARVYCKICCTLRAWKIACNRLLFKHNSKIWETEI